MNLHLRKFLTFIFLFLVLWLIAGAYTMARERLETETQNMITSSGLRSAKTEGLGVKLPGSINIKKFAFTLPIQRYSIPITLTDSQIQLLWSELLFLKKAFEGKTDLFSGSMNFRFKQDIGGHDTAIDTDFKNIDISQITPFGTFGVSGRSRGTIAMQLIEQPGAVLMPESVTFDLTFTELNFVGGAIPGILFPLPKISGGHLSIAGKIEKGIPKFHTAADCNLGTFKGDFTDNSIAGELTLSDEGEKNYGPLLVIASGRQEINDKKHWRISTSRDLKKISVSPVNP